MSAPIILHAGFHKTGTSSVQAALGAHRGAWAPHLAIMLRDDLGDLPRLARSFSHGQATPEALASAAQGAFSRIGPLPLIVSAEDLGGSLPGRGQIRDYRAAIPIARILAETLLPTGRPIHFVYSTRAAQPWLRSLWWQHLRVMRLTASAQDFAETYAEAARFDAILPGLHTAVSGAQLHHVALEDSAAQRSGPVTPLLRLAGLTPSLWPAPAKPRNARPDLALEEVFLALNRSGLPDGFVAEQKRMILRKADRMAR